MGEAIASLDESLRSNRIFSGFSDDQFRQFESLVCERRQLADGELLAVEGESAEHIYLIEAGEIEVRVRESDTEVDHVVATLTVGDSVGEMALIDDSPRSASLRAVGAATVAVVPISALSGGADERLSLASKMKLNVAQVMAGRMRDANANTVKGLRGLLEEAERRAEMGKFMSRVLIGTCLYIFALGALKGLSHLVPDTTFVSGPILIAFAIALFINIKTSIYPPSQYGFNLNDWQGALREAILFSIPVMVLAVLMKWVLVHTHPSFQGLPVFDFYQSRNASLGMTVAAVSIYATFSPIQEMIARSGMQSSFQLFLTGKHKTWLSIFLSTLLFSSTHLHVSFTLAVLVFPLGLFWGWLYSRHPTLIGVSVSHVLIGCFGLFIVGFFPVPASA